MAICYLGFGSNTRREFYLDEGLGALASKYTIIAISPVYQSPALGFDGDDFYNLCVKIELDTTIDELNKFLKSVEDANGRERNLGKYSFRTLDIDILLVDALVGLHDSVQLPRSEIVRNDFVLKPLVDIAPDLNDPVDGVRYAQKWALLSEKEVNISTVECCFNHYARRAAK